MNRHINIDTVEIIDKEGRRRQYLEQKNMLFVGCDGAENIAVEASYNAAEKIWYVQAIAQPAACVVANAGREPILFQGADTPEAGLSHFLPGDTKHIPYGRRVRVNDHLLTFHRKRMAQAIEVDLFLPDRELPPPSAGTGRPLEGTVTLRNKGAATKVQFHVRVNIEGAPAGAYQLDKPSPRLAHVRERSINFFLYHLPGRPVTAGYYRVEIYAEANEYPGQTAADFQEIYVTPFYEYELEVETNCQG